MNKIIASAVRHNNIIFTGVRHCEIFSDLRKLGINGPYFESNGFAQGFIDSNGTFLYREEAEEVVKNSGQPYKALSSTLTSEDLW